MFSPILAVRLKNLVVVVVVVVAIAVVVADVFAERRLFSVRTTNIDYLINRLLKFDFLCRVPPRFCCSLRLLFASRASARARAPVCVYMCVCLCIQFLRGMHARESARRNVNSAISVV